MKKDKENKVKQEQQDRKIKEENRKAGSVLLIIVLVAALAGGAAGFLLGAEGMRLQEIKRTFEEFMAANGVAAGVMASILAALASAGIYGYSIPVIIQGRRMASEPAEIEEEKMWRLEKKLGYINWMASLLYVLTYFYISAMMFLNYRYLRDDARWVLLLAVLLTLAGITGAIVLQQKTVDLERRLNPEKRGSVYDLKFQKKWEESCDEAQKLVIYRASYQAMKTINMMCIALWTIIIVISVATHTGFLAVSAILLLWGVGMSVYCYYSIKYSYETPV